MLLTEYFIECIYITQHQSRDTNSLIFFLIKGLMFGYATDETEECMPLTILLSHQLNARMASLRKNEQLPWARPDSKTQVLI